MLALLAFLMFSGCAAVTPKISEAGTTDSTSLIEQIYQNERFVCVGTEWMAEKQKLLNDKSITSKNSTDLQNGNTVKLNKKVSLHVPNMEVYAAYSFSNDRLVSFSYIFNETDDKKFLQTCQSLKSVLNDKLPKPFSGSLSILDQKPDDSGSSSEVSWKATDDSRLTISVYNNTKTEPKNPFYIISIQIDAPKNVPSSLAKK